MKCSVAEEAAGGRGAIPSRDRVFHHLRCKERSSMTKRSIRALVVDERGAALPFALLVAILLAMLASLLIANALMENRASFQSEQHEGTLHVAESGVEVGLNYVVSAPSVEDFTTGHVLDDDEADVRGWVEEAVEGVEEECPDDGTLPAASCLVTTSSGQATFVRPVSASTGEALPLIFGVGFTPSKDEARRTRVVKLDFTASESTFRFDQALLADGDVDIRGNNFTIEGNADGLHSNGQVSGSGNSAIRCGSIGTISAQGDVASLSGCDVEEVMHDHYVKVPTVSARSLYPKSAEELEELEFVNQAQDGPAWVDLCDDGQAREWSEHGPCDPGAVIVEDQSGWSAGGSWRPEDPELVDGRVYYIQDGDGRVASNQSFTFSVLVEGGDWSVTGSPGDDEEGAFQPVYPGVLFWVDGDVSLSGNAKIYSNHEAAIGTNGVLDLQAGFRSRNIAYLASSASATADVHGSNSDPGTNIEYHGGLELDIGVAAGVERARWEEL